MSVKKPAVARAITREEAAARSGLSVRTIDRLVASKEIAAWKFKRAIRIDVADFERYMDAHRTSTSVVHRLVAVRG